MSNTNRRLRALAYLLALFPLCWMQPTQAASVAADRPTQKETPSKPARGADDASRGGDTRLPDEDDCTRTLGYWKNHSAHAENPSQNIPWPISEETLLCDKTWYDILHTPSGGNAWVILAHQWIAAKLNAASGADTDVLNGALDEAEDLLTGNCDGLKGDDRDRALELAGLLDDYNNGRIGPGHCGETGNDCNGNGIDDSIDIDNGTSADLNFDGIPDECQPSITKECIGTGAGTPGGVDCPCGNTIPPGSAAGCVNRTGSGAQLFGSGVPSVSNDTLLLTVTGTPLGVPAYFFYGRQAGGTFVFGNGTRCLTGPLVNLRKVRHAAGGDQFPAPGSPPISVQLSIPAGETSFFQAFYRDRGGPCTATSNSTNVVKVVWGL